MSSPPANPPITDRSYGIIPLRLIPSTSPSSSSPTSPTPTTTNTHLLLIRQRTLASSDTFWCFPKGHPEPLDADHQATAIRELFEETGLKITHGDLIPLCSNETGTETVLRERYITPGRKEGKEVLYYPALVQGNQELRIQEKEVAEARWCGWAEAVQLATFGECRAMVGGLRGLLESGTGVGEAKEVEGEGRGKI
ncbi:uncharacterized protein LY89DRAFT_722062 [Mollisia scopiformis]|uniref:Nudix hydrolase domain-containing protein n=1 Tax=Mollisia scopiformis TaxID=149040 RepID=A0A194WXW7_MOLSC|nr:uncharacterized protein LY89DRAFT_722062 [Mollisia scopiformis]KUJ12442.1 hypothetical protein LY89DRAFT_722062 [Mollisia scopiformis]